jgi:hypothetical protein
MRLQRCIAYALIVAAGFCSRASAQTLGQALDNTNLVWTTSPSNATSRAWFSETGANSHDGSDCATSGNRTIHSSSSWLETTLIGPGVLSYWIRVSSEEPLIIMDEELVYFDYLSTTLNGNEIDVIGGPCGDWLFRSYQIPAGTNTVRWTYMKDSTTTDPCSVDQVRIDQVTFTPGVFPLGEALGTCGHNWYSGVSTNATEWVGLTNVTFDGKAAESGLVDINQETWMRVNVSGITNVAFLWRVSSRTNSDYLEFYTNSYVHNPLSPPANYAARISGEVTTWRSNFFRISPSATTLTWRYVKSALAPVGQNHGWVDQVKLTPETLRTQYVLSEPARLTNGRFQFTVSGASNCTCRIEASTNLVNWSTVTDVFPVGGSTTVIDSAATNQVKRFYRGLSL